MKKLLNTLYITSPNSYLIKDGENVVVKVDEKERFRIPVHNLESIVCFGYAGASPGLMYLCSERNVSLSFHNAYGRFIARLDGKVKGNVLLRRTQYRIADDRERSIPLIKHIVKAKILNSRSVLQRMAREREAKQELLESAIRKLKEKFRIVDNANEIEKIRGIEGDSANLYFSVFDQLITKQKEDFFMKGRNRRPPLDNVNAMLSFVYVLLANDVQSALESVGLDPYVGFYHTDRPGRPSLALDMMEELRAYMADRLVLSMINLKQVNKKGFTSKETGGVVMNDDTRKAVLTAWQKRKQEKITHPFLNEKILLGLLPYSQALLMSRYMRGDIDDYPVFILK